MFTRQPEDRPFGRLCAAVAATALILTPDVAAAGGFDLPDNGTEALGRGGAFVAKASDGSAIHHNPAGLARQRGTHLYASGNLYFHSFEFHRLGVYPDNPNNADTPWGDKLYPAIKNAPQMQVAPMAVVTTDFGYFDRFTLAAGIYAPSSLSNRTFPLSISGQTPSPSRYDFVQGRSSTWLPTLASGVRITKWLDLGISGHLVLAHIDQTMVGYSDVGSCQENAVDGEKRREDWHCDTETRLDVTGTSFAATIGAMLRPAPWFALGLSFRTPTNISANGTITPTPPKALPDDQSFKAGSANYAYQLPWAARLGARYIGMDAAFELYDLELDLTYEGWGTAQGAGPILTAPDIGTFKPVQTVIMRGYNNTLGIRAGGTYNFEVGDGVLALRGGAYFDGSATSSFATTRLDYDTLPKVAGTVGLGYKIGPATFDVAYAAVASIPRTVGAGAGRVQPINLADAGSSSGADGTPLSPVNEGTYRGFTHIVSLGASLSIEGLFGPPRKVEYGRPYEPNYGGPLEPGEVPPPKPVVQKPVEKPIEKAPEPPPAPKPIEKAPEPPPSAPKPVEKAPEPPPAPKPVEAPPKKPAVEPAPPPAPPPPPPVVAPPPKKERKPPSKRREWWEAP